MQVAVVEGLGVRYSVEAAADSPLSDLFDGQILSQHQRLLEMADVEPRKSMSLKFASELPQLHLLVEEHVRFSKHPLDLGAK
jgi:hypothetical protein